MHPRLAFLILPCTRAGDAGGSWARRHDVVLRPRAVPSAEFSDWLWK